ncbi:hypothetical protein OY671_007904, partial [Metschnikowia pulcherrima]
MAGVPSTRPVPNGGDRAKASAAPIVWIVALPLWGGRALTSSAFRSFGCCPASPAGSPVALSPPTPFRGVCGFRRSSVMNAVTETVAAEPVSGVEIFVPLAKLKKSPRNARKVPHGEAAIEASAASIQHKGSIQNLVVEPEAKEDGTPTGYYLVTAGEGRRSAMSSRAKRKEIRKNHLVRCWLDTENDPAEVSLDENYNREQLHPADQFERLHELSRDKGWGAEEIGARFGVSASVVKQRLRLGAVSPKSLQVYREDGLT